MFLTLLKATIKSEMQYKTNFIFNIIQNLLTLFSDFVLVALIMLKFKNIGGWNIYEVAILYSVIEIGFGLFRMFGEGIHRFEELMISGNFDAILLRPINTFSHVLMRLVDVKKIGGIIQGILVGIWGMSKIDVNFEFVFFYLIMCFASFLIILEVATAISAIAFWTTRISDLMNIGIYATRTACTYPASVYSPILRGFLTFIVPFATTSYFPLSYLLGKSTNSWYLLLPFAGCILFAPVAYLLWTTGIKRYTSTGT